MFYATIFAVLFVFLKIYLQQPEFRVKGFPMKKIMLSLVSAMVFSFLSCAVIFAQEAKFNLDGLSGELGFLNTWKFHKDGSEDFLMQVDAALMYPLLSRFLYVRGFMNYMTPLTGEDEFIEAQVGPVFAFLEDLPELCAVWGASFGFSNRDKWRVSLYTDAIMEVFITRVHLLYFFDFGGEIDFWRMRSQASILLGSFEVGGVFMIDRQGGGFGPIVSANIRGVTFEVAGLYDLHFPTPLSEPLDAPEYSDIYESWFLRFGVRGAF